MANQYVPDKAGCVYVDGNEDRVRNFLTKHRGHKQTTEELDAEKVSFRQMAVGILSQAAEGARAVFFRDGKRGGVTATQPDYTKAGNRSVLAKPLMKKFLALGGPSALGISEDELYDSETQETGPSIVLTGPLVDWFRRELLIPGKLNAFLDHVQDNQGGENTVTKLSPSVINKLRMTAALGDGVSKEAAELLLDKGLKAMTVTVMEG